MLNGHHHEPEPAEVDNQDIAEGIADTMSPTDLLAYQHRLIEQVLNCLERMMDQSALERRLLAESAREIVRFLREYAEGIHLDREERFVFPLIAESKCPEGCSVQDLMTRKHQESQYHLETMEKTADTAAAGDRHALVQFVEAGQSYIALAMTYIEHEEDWLFRQIHRALNDEQQESLVDRLCADENRRSADGYAEVANRLAEQFGVRTTDSLSELLTRQED